MVSIALTTVILTWNSNPKYSLSSYIQVETDSDWAYIRKGALEIDGRLQTVPNGTTEIMIPRRYIIHVKVFYFNATYPINLFNCYLLLHYALSNGTQDTIHYDIGMMQKEQFEDEYLDIYVNKDPLSLFNGVNFTLTTLISESAEAYGFAKP